MKVKILITDRYLKAGERRVFDVQRTDGGPVDFYNDLLYDKPLFDIDQVPTFLRLLGEGGYNYNNSGFDVGPITAGDEVLLEDGWVWFYVLDYTIKYPLDEVIEFALELREKCMEALMDLRLEERGLVDLEWKKTVIDSIWKIKALKA